MDVVGSEIGHKMRSAIKAKLTELGCYVDDELPDYVMVMVANKRTRSQMEDDLQLFLGDNTELFVNWLHQVLRKLQEVTVAAPAKIADVDKGMERSSSKERKSKEKKDKSKKSDSSKKSKKKAKAKTHKKKDEKKKSKKKSKHEMIRPNIPPLLMNMEKESEPSITDVFAGQILKNHGITLESPRDEKKMDEQKPILIETKRPILPIIDPATIPSQSTDSVTKVNTPEHIDTTEISIETPQNTKALSETDIVEISHEQENDMISQESENTAISLESENAKMFGEAEIGKTSEIEIDKKSTREEKLKEISEIEAKIKGLQRKLAEDSDGSDSTDDEDFLNIRTEADELSNDFGEDVIFKENSQTVPIATPPLIKRKSRSPTPPPPTSNKRKDTPIEIPETLPQIELNLPKRPVRERLGALTQKKDSVDNKERSGRTTEKAKSPERYTPEKDPEPRHHSKSAKNRLGNQKERTESQRKNFSSDESEKFENTSKRLTSRVSVLENRPSRGTCASVVRVRPRPRVSAPASSLLMRAVADAHKSLFNVLPKVEPEPQKVKRALVLPMRRSVDPKKIVIQIPCTEPSNSTPADSISDNVSLGDFDSEDDDKSSRMTNETTNKEEYTPYSLTKVIHNTEYVPTKTSTQRNDKELLESIDIHSTTVDKDKGTQFIVTMDGYHPNAFLAKKLMTEGLLNDDEEEITKSKQSKNKATKTERYTKADGSTKPDRATKSERITRTERTTKGLQVVLKNVVSGTDSEEDKELEEEVPILISSKVTVEPVAFETSDISKELAKDESNNTLTNEKRKSHIPVVMSFLEKEKSDIAKERSSIEKEINDNSMENIILETQNEDSSEDKQIQADKPHLKKRKSDISIESCLSESDEKNNRGAKKRKASPIVFDVHKKEKVRERTVSASSDSHIVLTTASNSHKYDALPPLSQAAKAVWCRAFPQCRYGSACAFAHPRCKFAAACTRRGCPYSHAPGAALGPLPGAGVPVVASHVVPAANYKTISAGAFANLCKFYPNCSNPACHYYHPKPCRYGKACTNKLECNFYHHDVLAAKWKYSI